MHRKLPARNKYSHLPLVQQLRQMVEDGLSLASIARDHDMTVAEVQQFLRT